MARTALQLQLRKLKRAKWNGPHLRFGKYRCDILPNQLWYACVDAKPRVRGRWRSVAGAKRAGVRAIRKLIRENHTA